MDRDHPTTNPGAATDAGPAVGLATDATVRATSRVPLWAWALAAGLIAGLVAWLGGEASYGYFKPQVVHPPGWDEMSPYERTARTSQELLAKTPPAETKNAAVAYGLLGALLGGMLGLAGGLARRSARGGLVALAVGALAGAIAGAGASAAMGPVFYRMLMPESGLIVPALAHGVIWAVIGFAGGLALALGLGDRRLIARAAFGGLIGGLIGTALFEAANAVSFPLVRVEAPIPGEQIPRLLAYLSVAICVALGASLSVRDRRGAPIVPARTA